MQRLRVARRLLPSQTSTLSLMLSTYEPRAGNSVDCAPIASPGQVANPNRSARTARGPVLILTVIAAFALVGIAFALWLRTVPAGNPDPRTGFNVFYVLFARNEVIGLAIVALFSSTAAWWIFRKRITVTIEQWMPRLAGRQRWCIAVVAIGVFAFTTFGTQIVFHDYALTADEYLADFQARIFLRGETQAQVPAAWVDAVRVIKPTYVNYFPATHRWNAPYLPVYAAMRAAFQYFDLQSMLNPFLAALTVLALYGTTRNIWPESKLNALVAVGLLASSSQFLLMSMTAYSMPAHLALNAVWLWLYSRPDRPAFYLAPFVGVLAIGLHEPIVHALFVLPFLARLVWQRRWRPVVIFGTVYLAGCVIWYLWKMHFQPPTAGGVAHFFRLYNPRMAIIQPMNLLLIVAWASLATPLLVLVGCKQFFTSRPIVQDAVLSCILTLGFYYFFYLDQAHGWGYRYFHGTLVCLILVAVAGFDRLSALLGQRRSLTFVVGGIVVSLLVQFPLRCIQAETFVRPYARSAAVLHAVHANVVALDPREAWYSADLIRNDPFLENRPVIVSLFRLTPRAIAALEKQGPARAINRDALTRLGLFTKLRNDYRYDPFELGRGK
jgi:hypothetical protein